MKNWGSTSHSAQVPRVGARAGLHQLRYHLELRAAVVEHMAAQWTLANLFPAPHILPDDAHTIKPRWRRRRARAGPIPATGKRKRRKRMD
eukprot:1937197-Pyramimonas_sp.AAC.1